MTEERDEDNAVMRLMNALITKMETMDSQMSAMRADLRNPDTLLKRAGFVRMNSPSVDDVWGDPLRGDLSGVIEKAGDGTEIDAVNLPSSNEEWHDMDWGDIHALAEQAGAPTESGFSTTRRSIGG